MRPAQVMQTIACQSRIRSKSIRVLIRLFPNSEHHLTVEYIMDWMLFISFTINIFNKFLPFYKEF